MKDKGRVLFILCLLGILLFTVFILLDTFVISRPYKTNAVEMNTAMFDTPAQESTDAPDGTDAPAEAPVSGETPVQDETGTEEDAGETDATSSAGPESSSADDRDRSAGFYGREYAGRRRSSRWDMQGRRRDMRENVDTDIDEDTEEPEADLYGDTDGFISDTEYRDDDISVTVTEYRVYDTCVYAADITLSSVQYLKTAFADDTYGRNVTEKTSVTARAKDAILAINGDYYGAQERGYVIRNGIVYRDTAKDTDILCIYADGTMEIISDRAWSAEELVRFGVWQAFTFGPALIENGSAAVGRHDEVSQAMVSNPRTAVGMIEKNHFVFVVSDGRTNESKGLTLYELAQFMKSLGVTTAYNLDGGGSSAMYFGGRIINNPTTNGRISERSVSDIVYIR